MRGYALRPISMSTFACLAIDCKIAISQVSAQKKHPQSWGHFKLLILLIFISTSDGLEISH